MTIEYNKKLFSTPVYEVLKYAQLDALVRKNYNVVDLEDENAADAILAFKAKRIDPFILDDSNREIYQMLCQYFSGDESFELHDGFSLKKGIILVGPVGCGKTSLMRMFGQNSFRPFKVIHCRTIAGDYSKDGSIVLKTYSEKQIGYEHQNFGHKSLGRCFDDLGTEVLTKHFGNQQNVMQDILYRIYDNQSIGEFHITTNLTGEEIEESYGTRIRDRMREMFNQMFFDPAVKSRRV